MEKDFSFKILEKNVIIIKKGNKEKKIRYKELIFDFDDNIIGIETISNKMISFKDIYNV